MCDNDKDLKLFCSHCEKMLNAAENFKPTPSVKSKTRHGYGYLCIDCNRDVQVVKNSKKLGIEKLKEDIKNVERILRLKHIALAELIEKEEEGILKLSK
jgi:flavoprotein